MKDEERIPLLLTYRDGSTREVWGGIDAEGFYERMTTDSRIFKGWVSKAGSRSIVVAIDDLRSVEDPKPQ